MRCPKCGADLTYVETFWVCPTCRETLDDDPYTGLPRLDLARWPSFVAIPVRRWLEEAHPVQRLWRICDACEVLARYVFAVGVADLDRRSRGEGLPGEFRRQIGTTVRFPSFGGWIAMVSRVFEALDALDTGLESSAACRRARQAWEGGLVELLGKKGGDLEGHVYPLRNFLAHAGGVGMGEGRRLLEDCGHERRAREVFAAQDGWLGAFVAYYVPRADDSRADLEVWQLRGTSGIPQPVDPIHNDEFRQILNDCTGSVVLCSPQAPDPGEVLDLTPICGFARPRVEKAYGQTAIGDREVPEVYFRKPGKALEYNVLTGERSFSERSGEALGRFERLFRVERGGGDGFGHGRGFEQELREDATRMVGRRSELAHVIETIKRLHKTDAPGILWLKAAAGMGKSMLMSKVATHRSISGDPKELLPITWQFKTGDHRNSRAAFLRHAVDTLQASPLELDAGADIDVTTAGLKELAERFDALLRVYGELESPAEFPEARAPSVVFFLDGLDEISARDSLVASMPWRHRYDNVLWVCAGRPEVDDLFEGKPGVTEIFPANEDHPDGGLPPMSNDDIRLMFLERLGEQKYDFLALEDTDDGQAADNPLVEAVAKRANGLPIYVELVVQDLFKGELDIQSAARGELPDSLDNYFASLLDRYDIGVMKALPTYLVALLVVAHEPLTERALHAALVEFVNLKSDDSGLEVVSKVLTLLGGMLRRVTTPEGAIGYRLYHDSFRTHLAESPRMEQPIHGARTALADAAAVWSADVQGPLRPYLLRYGVAYLLGIDRTKEAADLLRELSFAEAVCRVAGPHRLAEFYRVTSDALGSEHLWSKNLRLMGRAVERNVQFLRRHPDHLFQQMYNLCWWYDSPEAAKHYEQPEIGWQNPPWEREGPKLSSLMDLWREKGEDRPNGVWIRNHMPPDVGVDSALRMTIRDGARLVGGVIPTKRLIIGVAGSIIKVWNRRTGEELTRLEGHQDGVSCIACCADGRRAVSGSKDSTVRVWDLETETEIACFDGHDGVVHSVACNPNGELILSASADNTVRIWNVERREEVDCIWKYWSRLLSVNCSPTEKRVVTRYVDKSAKDHSIKVWNLTSNKAPVWLQGHTDTVSCVAFGPNGRYLVSGSSDSTVRVWDLDSSSELHCFKGHRGLVTSVAFHDREQLVVSASADGTVRVWSLQNKEQVQVLIGHTRPVTSVSLEPDGSGLLSGSIDGTVRLWDLEPGAAPSPVKKHQRAVTNFAFAPDGRRIVSGGEGLRIWNVATGAVIDRVETTSVFDVTFNKNGTRFASGTANGSVEVWRIQDGTIRKSNESPREAADPQFGGGVACLRNKVVCFSPCDTSLVPSNPLARTDCWVARVAFGDESSCAGWVTDIKELSSVADQKEWVTLNVQPVWILRFAANHDESKLATYSNDGHVRIWDIKKRECIREFNVRTDLNALLAIGDEDQPVLLPVSSDSDTKVFQSTLPSEAEPVVSMPMKLDKIVVSSSRTRVFAGLSSEYLHIFTIEGRYAE